MGLTDLLKKPAAKISAADAECDLATAQTALAAAAEGIAAAQRAYQAVLLDADDAALRAADDKRREAERAHDRAKAVVAALVERLAAVRARDDQVERRTAYDAAKASAEAAAARLRKEYGKAAQTIVDIVADLARADLAVLAANAARPAGAEMLDLPESMVRDASPPARIIREKTVTRWVYQHTGSILSDQDVARIAAMGDGRSYLPSPASMFPVAGSPSIVVKKQFREIEEEVVSPRSPPRLASEIALPALHTLSPVWTPMEPSWTGLLPSDVVAQVDALAKQHKIEDAQAVTRTTRMRLEPLPPEPKKPVEIALPPPSPRRAGKAA